jgi:hypothetical protein
MGGFVSNMLSGVLGGASEGLKGAENSGAAEQLAEQRAENAKLAARTEEEKRLEAERLAGRRSARLRGGSRILLSEARLTPETGLQTTLGSGQQQP